MRKLTVLFDLLLVQFSLALLSVKIKRVESLVDLDGTVGISAIFLVLTLGTLRGQTLGLRVNLRLKCMHLPLLALILFNQSSFLLLRYLSIHKQSILQLLTFLQTHSSISVCQRFDQWPESHVIKFL